MYTGLPYNPQGQSIAKKENTKTLKTCVKQKAKYISCEHINLTESP